jgi:hypothetical protein
MPRLVFALPVSPRAVSACSSFARAAHPPLFVSGWPLFEGGTINAEDDAR